MSHLVFFLVLALPMVCAIKQKNKINYNQMLQESTDKCNLTEGFVPLKVSGIVVYRVCLYSGYRPDHQPFDQLPLITIYSITVSYTHLPLPTTPYV